MDLFKHPQACSNRDSRFKSYFEPPFHDTQNASRPLINRWSAPKKQEVAGVVADQEAEPMQIRPHPTDHSGRFNVYRLELNRVQLLREPRLRGLGANAGACVKIECLDRLRNFGQIYGLI
ncbi:hypothetical protein KM043_004564 [Ampulex compressa]|nr:hypothetical protein KM043_004564 [Ampulex compressa]